MTLGPQPITTKRIALAFETAGARATSPTIYIIPGGKITPTSERKLEEYKVAGNRDAAMAIKGGETSKLSIPMMALVDNNGLGELLLGTFGTDTPAQQGGTSAYRHAFTANDTAKSMTIWCWDTINPQSIRMVVVDSLKIEIDKEKNRVDFTFDCLGADMQDSSTFGSASYVTASSTNLLPASGAILEYGEPLANVRSSWEKITINMKEGAKFGAVGKNAPIPSGSSSPKLVVKGARETTIDIELIDMDGKERRRCREGGNVEPDATADADNAAVVAFRIRIFGAGIASHLWTYADLNNTATVAVANLAVYSTDQGSNKDLTFTAKTPGVIPTITYADGSELAVAVASDVDITVTLNSDVSTADDIIAAIQADAEANALVTVARKTGQNGTGTPDAFTEQSLVAAASGTDVTVSGAYTAGTVAMIKVWIDANDTPDTFSWQENGGTTTTGVAITGSAQALGTTGVSVTFSSTTGGTVGDTFYIFSYYQQMFEFSSLTNMLSPWKEKDSDDFYRGTVTMKHVSGVGGTKPSAAIVCSKTSAYA